MQLMREAGKMKCGRTMPAAFTDRVDFYSAASATVTPAASIATATD